MMGYQRILVTLDGSELSEIALKHVTKVAEPGAQLHLLSVITEDRTTEMLLMASSAAQPFANTSDYWQQPGQTTDMSELNGRQNYLAKISEVWTERGYKVTTEVRPGEVVDAILEASQRFEVIVMATHGRTGLNRLLLGSVAESVLHKAVCPVLLIPAKT
jgi:nucleotide-binding universal stress UspA family protein